MILIFGWLAVTLIDLLPETPEPDAVFDAFAGWSKRRGLALYPHQEDALIEIVSGANVILSTPTGSGKSLVAAGRAGERGGGAGDEPRTVRHK